MSLSLCSYHSITITPLEVKACGLPDTKTATTALSYISPSLFRFFAVAISIHPGFWWQHAKKRWSARHMLQLFCFAGGGGCFGGAWRCWERCVGRLSCSGGGGSWGILKPDGRNNPSFVFQVCPKVSFQLDLSRNNFTGRHPCRNRLLKMEDQQFNPWAPLGYPSFLPRP